MARDEETLGCQACVAGDQATGKPFGELEGRLSEDAKPLAPSVASSPVVGRRVKQRLTSQLTVAARTATGGDKAGVIQCRGG